MPQSSYITVLGSEQTAFKVSSDQSRSEKPRKPWLKSTRLQIHKVWSDTWFLEIVAMLISIACSIGIYATLGSLNGKPLPPMSRTLTLNTIIAFFSAIAKSSLVLVVTSCIGQLKWKWYQRYRRVKDAQLFDDAGRGPLGSFQMLLEHRGKSVACLGATILLLALLYDPFVQQAVVYPSFPMLYPSNLATANQARIFLAGMNINNKFPIIDQEALNLAIWSNGSSFDPEPHCPSTDCEWDPFTSLDICSTCGAADPLPHLKCDFALNSTSEFTKPCFITFRNGKLTIMEDVIIPSDCSLSAGGSGCSLEIFGPGYGVYDTFEGPYDLLSRRQALLLNETIRGIQMPLAAITVVRFNLTETSLTVASAEECTLHFCLRDYTMATVNNTQQVSISNVRNGTMAKFVNGTDDLEHENYWCWVADGETFSLGQSDSEHIITDGQHDCGGEASCVYTGSYVFDTKHFAVCGRDDFDLFRSWGEKITDHLTGTISQKLFLNCTLGPPCNYTRLTSLLDGHEDWDVNSLPTQLLPKDALVHIQQVGIHDVMRKIADSMTLLNLAVNGTVVEGRAGGPVVHVHVRWVWLSLPFSLLAAAAFMFLYTVIETRRHNIGLWKSSALAFLYHGLETEELHADDNDVEAVSGMELKAVKLKVRLKKGHAGGRTVMQSERGRAASDESWME